MDELRARYQEVTNQVRPRSNGPNLTEPLAGLAGTLVGTILSPGGAIVASYMAIRFLKQSLGRLMTAIGALIIGPIATAIGVTAGILLLPIGLIFGIIGGVVSRGALREGYDLLGSIAELLIAVTEFINQILGPRENIRNPLVRQVLELFDRVAVLFSHIFAAFAVLVTRIGPLIIPLARQGIAFINLIEAVVHLLREIFEDIFSPFTAQGITRLNPMESVNVVVDGLKRLLPLVLRRLTSMLTKMSIILAAGMLTALPKMGFWFVQVALVINRAILQHWAFRGILAGIRQIQIIRSAIPNTPSTPATPSSGSGFSIGSLPFVPPVPTLPALPEPAKVEHRAAGQPEFSLGLPSFSPAKHHFAPHLRQTPTSVFTSEHTRMRSQLGQSPTEALQEIRQQEMGYRNHLFRIVGQILPPEIRVRMPELLSMFRSIDRHLYQEDVHEPENQFPVLDLPSSDRLRPVVQQLTIRSHGSDIETIQRFKDRLVQSLLGKTYLTPTGT